MQDQMLERYFANHLTIDLTYCGCFKKIIFVRLANKVSRC